MDIKNSLKILFSDFKEKVESEKVVSEKLDYLINHTIKNSFDEIKQTLKEDFDVDSFYQIIDKSLEFHIIENKDLSLPSFIYKIKIENQNSITVYTNNDDPDINAFKPKDIFGDIQSLDIFSLKKENFFDDFILRYRSFLTK